jgi:hypothetical protein
MPFASEKQRRFLWAKHPDLAKRWTAEYGSKPEPESRNQHFEDSVKKVKRDGREAR